MIGSLNANGERVITFILLPLTTDSDEANVLERMNQWIIVTSCEFSQIIIISDSDAISNGSCIRHVRGPQVSERILLAHSQAWLAACKWVSPGHFSKGILLLLKFLG